MRATTCAPTFHADLDDQYAYWRGFLGGFQRGAACSLALRCDALFFCGVSVAPSPCIANSKRIFFANAIGKTLRRKPECLLQKRPLQTCTGVSFSARSDVLMACDVGNGVVLRNGGA